MSPKTLKRKLRFTLFPPLVRHQKIRAALRFVRWKISSWLALGPTVIPFVGEARLIAAAGMTDARGNIYAGLYDFRAMAFLLHLLRENDRFVDVGSNIGSFTVLASKVVGAECLAIEPIPGSYQYLLDNVSINRVSNLVTCLNVGVGRASGTLEFTCSLDTTNHVLAPGETAEEVIWVPVRSLDAIAGEFAPTLLKIDTEGYETAVIAGADGTLTDERLLAVIVELRGHGRRYGFDESEVHSHMLNAGFSQFSYDPFARKLTRWEEGGVLENNALYIRNMELAQERVETAPAFTVNGQRL